MTNDDALEQEITYRAVPYTRDFDTRHEAIGFAQLNRIDPDDKFPEVVALTEEKREIHDRLEKMIPRPVPKMKVE